MSVYVSLGSNLNPQTNIANAVNAMRAVFGALRLSPVYQSAAVGFDGADFLNLVAGFETEMPVEAVVSNLRKLESALGRNRRQPRYSDRPIDLDILLYDDLIYDDSGIQIPRYEIVQNAYVLKPLQDLAADLIHPLEKQSYRDLWQARAARSPSLKLFELSLD